MKNKKGFGTVEILLAILVIGLIAIVGWLVFDRNKKQTDNGVAKTVSNQQVATVENNNAENAKPDLTKDWQTYSNKAGGFSFKYPSTWAFTGNPEDCSEGLVLFGVNMSGGKNSAGKCASDGARAFGQMSVTWRTDRADLSLCGLGDVWNTDLKESTTVAGVPAIKTTGTYIADDQDMGGNAKGNTAIQYCLVKNNTQYIASYIKWEDYPDALADFNLMVAETFKLN